jgi:hypothetical protein
MRHVGVQHRRADPLDLFRIGRVRAGDIERSGIQRRLQRKPRRRGAVIVDQREGQAEQNRHRQPEQHQDCALLALGELLQEGAEAGQAKGHGGWVPRFAEANHRRLSQSLIKPRNLGAQ